MTELEKYEIVNKAESIEELQKAILAIAEDGVIMGRQRQFLASTQALNVPLVVKGEVPNILTRSYGIRQQALYIKHYQYLETFQVKLSKEDFKNLVNKNKEQ